MVYLKWMARCGTKIDISSILLLMLLNSQTQTPKQSIVYVCFHPHLDPSFPVISIVSSRRPINGHSIHNICLINNQLFISLIFIGIPDTADGGLRDLLLRVAAFGLYVYSFFGVIAGAMNLNSLQHFAVLITSSLTIIQVWEFEPRSILIIRLQFGQPVLILWHIFLVMQCKYSHFHWIYFSIFICV